MRHPLVAGVAGGVGTTTVAAAVAASDCGVYRPGRPVDVVVCRDTVASLGSAHRAINASVGTPLLVVVASTPASMPKPSAARIEMVRPHVLAVTQLPFVARWREVDDPWAQAAAVLRHPQVPKWLKPFAQQAHQLHAQLLERVRTTPSVPAASPPPPWESSPAFP